MVYFIIFLIRRSAYFCLRNSSDPDQMLHFAASDLSLHCLPVSFSWETRHKWVNVMIEEGHANAKKKLLIV